MERILGIDYGVKRIGLAMSDLLGLTAQPLEVIERKSLKDDFCRIGDVIRKNGVARIVLGMPFNMDGTPGILTEEIERFANKLRAEFQLPIEFFDERLTSWEAERFLIEEADISREKRKKVKDKLAASFILQGYLDRKAEHRE